MSLVEEENPFSSLTPPVSDDQEPETPTSTVLSNKDSDEEGLEILPEDSKSPSQPSSPRSTTSEPLVVAQTLDERPEVKSDQEDTTQTPCQGSSPSSPQMATKRSESPSTVPGSPLPRPTRSSILRQEISSSLKSIDVEEKPSKPPKSVLKRRKSSSSVVKSSTATTRTTTNKGGRRARSKSGTRTGGRRKSVGAVKRSTKSLVPKKEVTPAMAALDAALSGKPVPKQCFTGRVGVTPTSASSTSTAGRQVRRSSGLSLCSGPLPPPTAKRAQKVRKTSTAGKKAGRTSTTGTRKVRLSIPAPKVAVLDPVAASAAGGATRVKRNSTGSERLGSNLSTPTAGGSPASGTSSFSASVEPEMLAVMSVGPQEESSAPFWSLSAKPLKAKDLKAARGLLAFSMDPLVHDLASKDRPASSESILSAVPNRLVTNKRTGSTTASSASSVVSSPVASSDVNSDAFESATTAASSATEVTTDASSSESESDADSDSSSGSSSSSSASSASESVVSDSRPSPVAQKVQQNPSALKSSASVSSLGGQIESDNDTSDPGAVPNQDAQFSEFSDDQAIGTDFAFQSDVAPLSDDVLRHPLARNPSILALLSARSGEEEFSQASPRSLYRSDSFTSLLASSPPPRTRISSSTKQTPITYKKHTSKSPMPTLVSSSSTSLRGKNKKKGQRSMTPTLPMPSSLRRNSSVMSPRAPIEPCDPDATDVFAMAQSRVDAASDWRSRVDAALEAHALIAARDGMVSLSAAVAVTQVARAYVAAGLGAQALVHAQAAAEIVADVVEASDKKAAGLGNDGLDETARKGGLSLALSGGTGAAAVAATAQELADTLPTLRVHLLLSAAAALTLEGEWNDAEVHVKAASEASEELGTPARAAVLVASTRLAMCKSSWSQALESLYGLWELTDAVGMPPMDGRLWSIYAWMARAHIGMGDMSEAAGSYSRLIAVVESEGKRGSATWAELQYRLGAASALSGDMRSAATAADSAASAWNTVGGTRGLKAAVSARRMAGAAAVCARRYAPAVGPLSSAVLADLARGAVLSAAESRLALAIAHTGSGRADSGLTELISAYSTLRKELGESHPRVQAVGKQLADVRRVLAAHAEKLRAVEVEQVPAEESKPQSLSV